MALCLDFYNATQGNGFYLNDEEWHILQLWENETSAFCTIQHVANKTSYTLMFENEIALLVNGYHVKMWLGNGTNVHRNIAHLCFEAPKEVRIFVKSTYEKIHKTTSKSVNKA